MAKCEWQDTRCEQYAKFREDESRALCDFHYYKVHGPTRKADVRRLVRLVRESPQ